MMRTSKSEAGFTLIETLMSLFISSFVILMLTGGILQVLALKETMTSNAQDSSRVNTITGDRQVEWHIFLHQLENYLQGTYDPIVGEIEFRVKEKTLMDKGYREVIYRRDSNNNKENFSRRASNGNQRMLTGIRRIEFSRSGGCLVIAVTFKNGDQYNGEIWIESWEEPVHMNEENEAEDKDLKVEEVKEGIMENGKRINSFNEEKTTENEEPQEKVPTEKVTEDIEEEGFE